MALCTATLVHKSRRLPYLFRNLCRFVLCRMVGYILAKYYLLNEAYCYPENTNSDCNY